MRMHICGHGHGREVRDVGKDAAWRCKPMAWSDLIAKIFTIKQELNPLLTAPWVNHRIFRKDWLHAVDQGVASDQGWGICLNLVFDNRYF